MPLSSRETASILLGLALLATTASVLRLQSNARYAETSGYEDRFYLPSPDWLGLFALGHREALADLLWTRTLVYYGEEFQHQGRLAHIFEYIEAILALDPDFRAVYHMVGTLGVYRPETVEAADVERTVALMQRGIDRFPDDGPLCWQTGATLAFELPHLYADDVAAADRARERGAALMIRASELGAAPAYAVLTSARLLARVGRADLAARHLEEMYAMTTDLDLRDQIAMRIAAIRSEAFGGAFVEESERFEEQWQREMPYAPDALYFLVGPVPAIDTNAALRDGFQAHVLEEEDEDLTQSEP